MQGVAAAAVLVLGAISALELNGQAPPGQNTPNSPPQNTAEMSTHDAPATFSTKVNLVMVPVVVRDSKGKAVGTLTKEDFQLFDKGKPQVISRFTGRAAGSGIVMNPSFVVLPDIFKAALDTAGLSDDLPFRKTLKTPRLPIGFPDW